MNYEQKLRAVKREARKFDEAITRSIDNLMKGSDFDYKVIDSQLHITRREEER